MPTIMAHALVPLALGMAAGRKRLPARVIATGMALAILPDSDVIGFKFGIAYASEWGHRGASHALFVALIAAVLLTPVLRPPRAGLAALFLFVSAASHGLLDAFTSGGLGPALFWPWSEARIFAPVRPIRVSPIGANFFSMRGVETLLSEARWVALPCLALGLGGWTFRRYRNRHDARPAHPH